jgi:CheY-like chemotaxis protein
MGDRRAWPGDAAATSRGQVGVLISGFVDSHLKYNADLPRPLRARSFVGRASAANPLAGALNMTGHADLTGQSILVVEDDYFIAADAAGAVKNAGAEVLGPCSTAEEALTELSRQHPTGALVDINLGDGPSFKVADALLDHQIPFIFLTGYDEGTIPARFADVPRLEKPMDLCLAVDSLAAVLRAAVWRRAL